MVPKTEIETLPRETQSTHRRLLRVAKHLFTTRGYEHASTSSIARLAGTSESQLMKHFGSKSGLLEAIFMEGWVGMTEEAAKAMEEVKSPPQKLQKIAEAALTCLERDPEWKQLLLLEARRIRKEGQVVSITEGFLGFVRLIDGVLYEMEALNMLRPGVPPEGVRSALLGMLEGMSRDRFLAQQIGYPANFEVPTMGFMMTLALGSFLRPPLG